MTSPPYVMTLLGPLSSLSKATVSPQVCLYEADQAAAGHNNSISVEIIFSPVYPTRYMIAMSVSYVSRGDRRLYVGPAFDRSYLFYQC